MATIRTLRASNSTLMADVTVGTNDLGSNVILGLRLDRHRDDELQAALAPLEQLLLARADETLRQASTRRESRLPVPKVKR